jgi:hypothetical protein
MRDFLLWLVLVVDGRHVCVSPTQILTAAAHLVTRLRAYGNRTIKRGNHVGEIVLTL